MTEAQLHASVAELLAWILLPPAFYTTFPAGWVKLGKATAGSLKGAGMKPGMPDILIFHKYRVTGIELKVGKAALSPDQFKVHAQLLAAGCKTYVCRCINDVIMALFTEKIPYRVTHIAIPKGKTDVEIIRRPDLDAGIPTSS